MDTKQKEMKGKDKTANQIKDDKSKNMSTKKRLMLNQMTNKMT